MSDLEQAKRYRQQAAELLVMAERMNLKEQRQALLAMATAYYRLAERLEEAAKDDED